MKKLFYSLSLIALLAFGGFFSFSPSALAVGEVCAVGDSLCCKAPQIVIDGGETANGCAAGKSWIGSETTGSCQTPVTCATKTFSCSTGQCTGSSTPPTASCSAGQINLGTKCADILTVIRESATDTIYKLWLTNILGRLVYVSDTDCTTGQIPVWNNTSKIWACGAAQSVWTTAGNDTYYNLSGNVGIGTNSPAGILDVRGGTAAASANATSLNFYAQNGGTGNTNGGNIVLMSGAKSGTGTAGAVAINTASPTAGYALHVNGKIFSSGDVDIGTSGSPANLTVNGDTIINGDLSVSAGSCFGPVFQQPSSGSTNGKPGTGGYYQAKAQCPADMHVCTTAEILNSINCNTLAGKATNGDRMWISNGAPSLPTPTNDCNGWMETSSSWKGIEWIYNSGTGGAFYAAGCDNSKKFSCCR